MAVYFIQTAGENAIKIGYAKEPQKRRAELQTGHHEELTVVGVIARGDMALERKLHDRFAKSHIRGEWFRPTEELLGFIEGVRACEDVPPEETDAKPVAPLSIEQVKFLIDVALWRAEFDRLDINHRIDRIIMRHSIATGHDLGGPLSVIEKHRFIASSAVCAAIDLGFDSEVVVNDALQFSTNVCFLDDFYSEAVTEGQRRMELLVKRDQSTIDAVRQFGPNKCVWCDAPEPRYVAGMFGWWHSSFNCQMTQNCVACISGFALPNKHEYLIDISGQDAPIIPRECLRLTPPEEALIWPRRST